MSETPYACGDCGHIDVAHEIVVYFNGVPFGLEGVSDDEKRQAFADGRMFKWCGHCEDTCGKEDG